MEMNDPLRMHAGCKIKSTDASSKLAKAPNEQDNTDIMNCDYTWKSYSNS